MLVFDKWLGHHPFPIFKAHFGGNQESPPKNELPPFFA